MSTTGTEPDGADEAARWIAHPGVRLADRRRTVSSHGLSISVHEWGDPGGRPILLAHGGFDFAATFSIFAPMLADAGYRVVSFDQRGHCDSDHAALYSWGGDLRDAVAVLDSISREPIVLVGHSKGGSLLTQLAQALPHRVSHLVNIDGMPSRRRRPDVSDHERSRLLESELAGWLDHRRRSASKIRRPDDVESLARRRARMNPRLSHEWLCFLVTQGARRDADGWRWKFDPSMRFGGFGPWRPTWELERLPGLTAPLLGLLARVPEAMGWETQPRDLEPYLPRHARIVTFEDSGHFVHIEHPRRVADLVLEFIA